MARKFRNPHMDVAVRRVQAPTGPGRTRKEFLRECDINVIVARALKGQGMPVQRRPALYGDFSAVTDFHEAQQLVEQAAEQFSELPAAVRKRFKNDPASMLAFVADKANLEEARELGLVPPAAPKEAPKPAAPPAEPAKPA